MQTVILLNQFDEFLKVINAIEDFWLRIAKLH